MQQGLILFAHGARDPRWAHPFEQVAARVRDQRPGRPVTLAYLEFMAPDLDAAGDALAEAGCQRIEVLPLFLGAGGHVRKDLPERLAQLRERHPAITWTLHAAAGESQRLVQVLADIAAETLAMAGQEQP